mmetsp:Transcript_1357/g.2450  ORF Transcript_1357/g.2450 Transcript_1357/m.2450 type:complete len:153 (-) Transcript_1357:90-548(-)
MTASKTPPLHVLRRILHHIRTSPKQDIPQSTKTLSTAVSSSSSSYSSSSSSLKEESLVLTGSSKSFKSTYWLQQSPLAKHVMSQYRAAKDAPPEQANLLRKMAYDMYMLKTDLRERERLHVLDGGAEVKLSPKEMSRLAARRAGLELPQETQ